MDVGMAVIFQNPGRALSDEEVYRRELRLADLAEPLGFDSLWSVEHHFTDYTLCPDVLQFLTWMAGRTHRIRLGSMVVVLPWHDPVRVAEQVAVLDIVSGGRLLLGLGRGAGRVEFAGFRVPLEESRGRFVEAATMLLRGLETGVLQYDGAFVRQPRVAIRPAPPRSFRGRTYAAAVSPESARIMAELGVGILIIPQKPWTELARELEAYRDLYRQLQGADPPAPVVAAWTFCDPDPGRAREGARRWIAGYYRSVLDHYEFAAGHLAETPGYEYYGKMAEKIREYGVERVAEYFVNLQVWGTPAECRERIVEIARRTGAGHFVGVFSYAGMPPEEAERNLRLFAAEVAPALRTLAPGTPEAVPAARPDELRVGLLGS